MSRLVYALILVAVPVIARPWQGIMPLGNSTLDVVGKFGEPLKTVIQNGREVLVYGGAKAIRGTVQVQFKCDPQTKEVQRIDVYPEPVIDAAEVERAYGLSCITSKKVEPCYWRKESPSKRVYFQYAKLGLAVFFKADGTTVQSFAFVPPVP